MGLSSGADLVALVALGLAIGCEAPLGLAFPTRRWGTVAMWGVALCLASRAVLPVALVLRKVRTTR
jgi:hypothetical protein